MIIINNTNSNNANNINITSPIIDKTMDAEDLKKLAQQ